MIYYMAKKLPIVLSGVVVCVTLMTSAGMTIAAEASGKQVCAPWARNADGIGPFDYLDPKQANFLHKNVEGNHFNKNVRLLIKGQTSAFIGNDLVYVLQRFPNHHGALEALMRLSDREKRERVAGTQETVECYLWRATIWSPEDGTAKALYGIHLLKKQQLEEALEQLNQANALNPESPNVHYNLGLLFLQKKDYEKATLHAKKAYALGFPLPGLKDKLRQAKAWTD